MKTFRRSALYWVSEDMDEYLTDEEFKELKQKQNI